MQKFKKRILFLTIFFPLAFCLIALAIFHPHSKEEVEAASIRIGFIIDGSYLADSTKWTLSATSDSYSVIPHPVDLVGNNLNQPAGYSYNNWSVYWTNSSGTPVGHTGYASIGESMSEVISRWSASDSKPSTAYRLVFSCRREAHAYYMSYNANGGSGTMSKTTCLYGYSYTLRENTFTREGYTFNGWNTSPDGSGTTYADKASIKNLTTEDETTITLYAQWKPISYTMTLSHYLYNIHTDAWDYWTQTTQSAGYGSTYTPAYNSPDGYSPHSRDWNSGWTVTEDGTFNLYYYPNTYTMTSYHYLYNPAKADWDYWTGTSADALYTSIYTPAYLTPPTGYHTYSKDCDTGWTVTGDNSFNIYYYPNTYTVSYDGNGGTVDNELTSKEIYYNQPIDLSPTASKDGYLFVGWNTDPNASNGLSSLQMQDEPNGLTLYAIYSIPVSDIKEVYVSVWPTGNPDAFRTYQFAKTQTYNMEYTYTLDNVTISEGLNGAYPSYAIFAYDHAGNFTILKQDSVDEPPVIRTYIQTVKHYYFDVLKGENGDWKHFDTVTEQKVSGETFTPQYLTPPEGFHAYSIDESYIVSEDTCTSAYYYPNEYTISFDACGGDVTPASKTILYGDVYGELPTPMREGYTFTGWYTDSSDGIRITASDQYTTAADTTLYAHWTINTYTVTYDYWTNGGTGVSQDQAEYDFHSSINLNIIASKEGEHLKNWNFIGWNTDPNASTALDTLIMDSENITLYAIFQKTITLTLLERNDNEVQTRTLSKTIYNNTQYADFNMSAEHSWSGWNFLGWSTHTHADAQPDIGLGATYTTTDDAIFYAIYTSDITLRYDTNGSPSVLPEQTQSSRFNASGEYAYSTFTLAELPVFSQHSFAGWTDRSGNIYPAGDEVQFKTDTLLTAQWDMYPEIEAYDRYFSLEDALLGKITTERLFEKVRVTDKEDGLLTNGTDVLIPDFNASDFIHNPEVPITYQATDSFGNSTQKRIWVHIIDTLTSYGNTSYYIRFIAPDFYSDGESFISKEQGGLEPSSIWITNEDYQKLLEDTLKKETPMDSYVFTLY